MSARQLFIYQPGVKHKRSLDRRFNLSSVPFVSHQQNFIDKKWAVSCPMCRNEFRYRENQEKSSSQALLLTPAILASLTGVDGAQLARHQASQRVTAWNLSMTYCREAELRAASAPVVHEPA